MTERSYARLDVHWARIYRYRLFRTHSRPEAEDLTAEVFRWLLEGRVQPKSVPLLPRLFRVARELCLNYGRRRSRQRVLSSSLKMTEEPSTEDTGPPWIDPRMVDAIGALNPSLRCTALRRMTVSG